MGHADCGGNPALCYPINTDPTLLNGSLIPTAQHLACVCACWAEGSQHMSKAQRCAAAVWLSRNVVFLNGYMRWLLHRVAGTHTASGRHLRCCGVTLLCR